jgi:hypothetical protein
VFTPSAFSVSVLGSAMWWRKEYMAAPKLRVRGGVDDLLWCAT